MVANNESTALMNFCYQDYQVRTVMIDGEPWFVLADVCRVLDLGSPHKVAERLEDDEISRNQIPTGNGTREAKVVSEAGLYSVIVRSDKPEAKPFRRWITHEVLPQIRKTGGYGKPQMPAVITADYLQEVVDHLRVLEQQVAEQGTMIAVQGQQIAELKPKASYCDIVLQSPDLVQTSVIAKDYGISPVAMNRILHDMGIQYKQGNIWLLYQKYADQGYTGTKTHTYKHSDGADGTRVWTYWTQKGRLWLYEMLKADGLLPLIERTEGDGETA